MGTAVAQGGPSFWHTSIGGPGVDRPGLPGPLDVDVCIVGAGYTGLWTAWWLRQLDPSLDVVVVEAHHAGFGASGRNGGWLSGIMPGDRTLLAAGQGGRDGVLSLQTELRAAVADVVDFCVVEDVDADVVVGGSLAVATTAASMARLEAELAHEKDWGAAPGDLTLLGAHEVSARVAVPGAVGGLFTPHCARIHPAKLVRGLAAAVERAGVRIFESTPVTAIGAHLARTGRGDVRARWVVRATEGYTASLPGARRALLPMNSSMVVTAPLSAQAWAEIGWDGCETVQDNAHAYVYAQRTADGRIALGGRGTPYRFGSRTDRGGRTDDATVGALEAALHRLFPAAAGAPIDRAWCGVLGVARDWCPSVLADPTTGLASAGGYVGDGVTTAALAGRTLAELLTGTDSPRVRLPWVGHHSPTWEPEPLRWAGVRAIYTLYRAADRSEARHPDRVAGSAFARVADRISGRP